MTSLTLPSHETATLLDPMALPRLRRRLRGGRHREHLSAALEMHLTELLGFARSILKPEDPTGLPARIEAVAHNSMFGRLTLLMSALGLELARAISQAEIEEDSRLLVAEVRMRVLAELGIEAAEDLDFAQESQMACLTVLSRHRVEAGDRRGVEVDLDKFLLAQIALGEALCAGDPTLLSSAHGLVEFMARTAATAFSTIKATLEPDAHPSVILSGPHVATDDAAESYEPISWLDGRARSS